MIKGLVVAAALGLMAMAPANDPPPVESTSFQSPGLGTIHVFGSPHAGRIAVILSGDGGWKPNEASGRTAGALAASGALALGVDVNQAMKLMSGPPSSPFDLGEALEKLLVQARARYGISGPATLSGYSAGATLAYAAFVQGPSGRFQALVTQGFCPDQLTVRPVGDAAGGSIAVRRFGVSGWVYPPAALPGPWALIEGDKEHRCAGGDVARFAASLHRARMWTASGVSHGFNPFGHWSGDLQQALTWVKSP